MGDEYNKVPLVHAHGECDAMLMKELTPSVSVENVLQGDSDVGLNFKKPHSKSNMF